MEFKKVKSGMIDALAYDDSTWTFGVRFKSGLTLLYASVPPEVADEFLNAESKGKHFNGIFKHLGYKAMEDPDSKKPEKPLPDVEGGLTEEDLKFFDEVTKTPKPDPVHTKPAGDTVAAFVDEKIAEAFSDGIPADADVPPHVWPTYGGIDRSQGVAITAQTQGEILPAWHAPDTAFEALDMLSEHKAEIEAIIVQNKATGDQALTVKITSVEGRTEASEVLNRLVAKKDKTVELLDPFRKVLYDAYSDAGAKVKAGVDPLEGGIRHVKAQCLSWDAEVERQRQQKIREDNERREAEARRLQEEESQRLTLAEAQDKLDQGDEAGAQMLFDAPIRVPRPYIPPTILPPAAPKHEGQSTTTTWKVDESSFDGDESGQLLINSIRTMLQAVKDGKYDINQAAALLTWNFKAANKLASGLMSTFNVPGLTAVPVSTMRVGRGKKAK